MSDELNTQEENAEAPIEKTELEEMELTPEAQIEALKIELEEAKAQVLYVKAEGENIRLAVESATVDSYKNGVELTAKQLLSVFEKFNIAEVNPTEEKFDPNKHQAISTIESEGEPNTVLSVLQKGYTLNDRVLRPALVVVSKAK